MSCMAPGPIARSSGDEAARRERHASLDWVRTALGVAALASASGLQAAGLFLPAGPASDVAPVAKAAPARRSAAAAPDAWERRVRVARHELAAARADVEGTGAGRLLLNVRDGVRLDVAVERTAPTMFGYSLSGRVAGGSASAGFVTLVVHEEAVAASIWTPDSAYELSYLGGGVHALRDVTNAPPVECGGALPLELLAPDATTKSSADDGSVADILVVWTPAAEEFAGGEIQVLSRIDMNVAFVNDAFDRSGALVSLNVVGAEEVDYVEVDSGIDLHRLGTPDDGHIDGVHDRRRMLGADLVHLLGKYDLSVDLGGRASFAGPFSVGDHRAWVLAHEVGHNFGLKHDRGDFSTANLSPWSYPYGFTTRRCVSTIMSYGAFFRCVGYRRASRVPFFASPWRYSPHEGRALGVTRFSKERGAGGPADAVLTLNRNRHAVANWRPSRNGE